MFADETVAMIMTSYDAEIPLAQRLKLVRLIRAGNAFPQIPAGLSAILVQHIIGIRMLAVALHGESRIGGHRFEYLVILRQRHVLEHH